MSTVRCANCGGYSATLHLTVELGGQPSEETALCDDCVERVERQALGPIGPLAPHALLAQLLIEPSEPSFRCPACGYDVEDLVRTGKLGCRHCYDSFADEVLNLIRRSIGRDSHRGKLPPSRPAPSEESEEVQ